MKWLVAIILVADAATTGFSMDGSRGHGLQAQHFSIRTQTAGRIASTQEPTDGPRRTKRTKHALLPPAVGIAPRVQPRTADGEVVHSANVVSAGLTITPTFDTSITTDANADAIEAAINGAIAMVESQFADPITVQIEFTEGSRLGVSATRVSSVPYATFLAALNADAKTPDDATALSLLPSIATNPVTGTTTITVANANLKAVGIATPPTPDGLDGTIFLNTMVTVPGSQGSTLEFCLQSIVLHEIDEVLGLGSALANRDGSISPEDLYRYSSTNTRTFSAIDSRTSGVFAYFSIDGITALAEFDNQNDGGDFGDWQSNPLRSGVAPKVQDAFADFATDPNGIPLPGVELTALDVIGYDRVAVPLIAPPIDLNNPANVTVPEGEYAHFTASAYGAPTPTVQWQSSSGGGGFVNITGATSTTYLFNATRADNGKIFRAVFTNAVGSATSASATLTVVALPTLTLDRSALNFTAINNGVGFTAVTSAQAVRMTQIGAGTVTWTASSDQPWLVVFPTSGTGSVTFNVSTQFVSGLARSQVGSIFFTVGGTSTFVGPITVVLNAIPPSSAQPPFGSFDTPTNGVTGVAGSIPVTGWALDAVQVTRVTVCRDAIGSEVAPVDPNCAGNVGIYIGDAEFVDGARPDVQGAFSTLPLNSRAGWGYLMLTNFLANGGNGTFTLHAYAFNAEGLTTALGSKMITCDNAHATKPFGAIDTPAQGGVVTGTIANLGWVLTQSPKDIPADSSTVTAFIDGVAIGNLDPGRLPRADITSLFSPTYDTSHAAGGKIIDTTRLQNGVHTLFWIVSDTGGQADGVGSRFFTVSNGTDLASSATATAPARSARVIASAPSVGIPSTATTRILGPRALESALADAPLDLRSVQGRRGYDLGTALQTYTDSSGRIDVQAEELDRIELHLSGGSQSQFTGYLKTPSGLRPLPVGSSLDAWAGTFTWTPGVGFYGKYDLTFVRWSNGNAVARQDVRITLNAKGSNRVGAQTIIDVPGQNVRVGSPFYVGGWAADLGSTVDSGVNTVHVWAYPIDSKGNRLDPIFVGPAIYGGARSDVAAVYGDRFADSGYSIIVNGLAPGTYDIAVFAFSTVVNNFTPAKVVRITVH